MMDRLTRQFVIYISVILFLVVGTTNYWLYLKNTESIRASLNQVAHSHLDTTSSLSGYYLGHYEIELLKSLVEQKAGEREVTYIGVIPNDKTFISSAGNRDAANSKIYTTRINYNQKDLGYIEIGIDSSTVEKDLLASLVTSTILALLSVLLLGGLLFAFYRVQILNAVNSAELDKKRIGEEKLFLRSVIDTSEGIVVVIRADGSAALTNKACEKMLEQDAQSLEQSNILGYFGIEHHGRSVVDMLSEPAPSEYGANLEKLETDKSYSFRKTVEGKEQIFEWRFTPLGEEFGVPKYLIATGNDITEQVSEKEELQFLAHHDPLTGLPNRVLFQDRLEMSIKHYQRYQESFAVLYIDIDRFKPINDKLGHDAGDHVLKIIAERLRRTLRTVDTPARMGGDEFAVLLTKLNIPEAAILVAKKLIESISLPIVYKNRSLTIAISIGISLCPSDGTNGNELINYADRAMFHSKKNGGNKYSLYSPSMSIDNTSSLALKA